MSFVMQQIEPLLADELKNRSRNYGLFVLL